LQYIKWTSVLVREGYKHKAIKQEPAKKAQIHKHADIIHLSAQRSMYKVLLVHNLINKIKSTVSVNYVAEKN